MRKKDTDSSLESWLGDSSRSVGPYYFPRGAFSDNEVLDRFHQEWYGKYLKAMDEPRLVDLPAGSVAVYRFLCLPSFEAPYLVRTNKTSTEARLRTKKTRGQHEFSPSEVVSNEGVKMSTSQWRSFEEAVKEANFWCMPTTEQRHGLDGTRYIVEGRDRNDYHVVDRWCPKPGPFKKLCDRFVELSLVEAIGRAERADDTSLIRRWLKQELDR